jgi:hypothetical protein
MANETNSKDSNNDIAFRNESIATIRELMNENKTLRDTISQAAKRRKSEASKGGYKKISGLQQLGSTVKLS